MFDLNALNPQQRQAAEQFNGPMMILAGAGTGKTRVITCRITHSLRSGIPPESIVAVTFTNKAAREMAERIKEMAGASAAKKLRACTFHSFCLNVLRSYPAAAGIDPGFTLVGTGEQIDFVRRVLDEKGWSGLYKADDIHALISKAKNKLLLPEDLAQQGEALLPEARDLTLLAQVYNHYERQLKLHRAIDFDDCILKTVLLLRGNVEVREALEEKYRYLLVDEFQDTNFAQLSIIQELCGRNRNICVVGDDDQSIYSWRGAMVETLQRFEEIFPETKTVFLEQNYRCTNVILNAANKVIAHNTNRKPKKLWSTHNADTPVLLASLESDLAEAQWIADKCYALLGAGHKLRDIAILYRANAQSRPLEMALRERRLAYKIFGGSGFFERKEVKDLLAYLRLIFNPDDRVSLWRVVNTPPRGIGIKTLEKIAERAQELGLSPLSILEQKAVDLGAKAQAAVDAFVGTLKRIAQGPMTTPEDLETLGHAIIKEFRLDDEIKLKTADAVSRQRKLEFQKQLPTWLKTCAQQAMEKNDGELDPVALLDALSLADNEPATNADKNEEFISLMTIHASKGLEFPAVFLCGIEEDQLPHKNSVGEAVGLAEERRLFYVAMTRAKEKLFLSHALTRFSGFQSVERKPSRFLDELPKQGVVRDTDAGLSTGERKEKEEERRQQTISRLASLKDSLRASRS